MTDKKNTTQDDAIRVLREALDQLARLGNGSALGNSDGNLIAQRALAATANVQPVAAQESPQQAHVLPPFAAPAGQHDADERAFDTLHGAVMNLPCKPGRAIAMHGASKQAYQEGHRDARHAAADLISESASGSREGRNTSPESTLAAPVQATPPAAHAGTPPERDSCQFCLGAKGGVPGNENVFNGVVACDYCSCLLTEARPTRAAVAESVATALDLSTENWSGVFHTAFRHAGNSQQAAAAHAAIEKMDASEWGDIVDYMLHGIRTRTTTYGAQQREAGRRDRDAEVAKLHATALRVAQCAGEFANDARRATKPAEGLSEADRTLIADAANLLDEEEWPITAGKLRAILAQQAKKGNTP